MNRQLTLGAVESGRDQIDQVRRQQYAEDDQNRSGEREQSGYGAGGACRFLFILLREQSRVNGNERGGKDAFAEQRLQKIGNAERSFERVGGIGIAEIMRENALANEASEAAQKNAGGDQKRMAFGSAGVRGALGWTRGRYRVFGSRVRIDRFITEGGRKDVNLELRALRLNHDHSVKALRPGTKRAGSPLTKAQKLRLGIGSD